MIKLLSIGLFVYFLYRLVFTPSRQIPPQTPGEDRQQSTIDVDYEEVE